MIMPPRWGYQNGAPLWLPKCCPAGATKMLSCWGWLVGIGMLPGHKKINPADVLRPLFVEVLPQFVPGLFALHGAATKSDRAGRRLRF